MKLLVFRRKLRRLLSSRAWRFQWMQLRQFLIELIDPNTKLIREHRLGDYYSPIVNPQSYSTARDDETYWASTAINESSVIAFHLQILQDLQKRQITFSRFKKGNNSFPLADATTLSHIINKYKPNRIVEIGSGWSSAAILDALDFWEIQAKCIFIEPYPERLEQVLTSIDRLHHTHYLKEVQDVPLSTFATLCENDILFIDSSHVLKLGSDLAFLMLRVIPVLPPGVIIHFHDIFYPHSLPYPWIQRGWSWNETLALRLMLTYGRFNVLAFNSLFGFRRPEMMNAYTESHGGSIWLQKL